MAFTGGGVLKDVHIGQQDGEEVASYLVLDDGDSWGILTGEIQGTIECNPTTPYSLLEATVSYTVTDQSVENEYWPTGSSELSVLTDGSLLSCPPD